MGDSQPPDLGAVPRSVLDRLTEGVVVLDGDWVYRYVNAAGAQFLGTTVDALVGEDYRVLYPEAKGTAFQLAYQRVMTSGRAETLDDYYPPWDKFFRNRIFPWDGGVAIFFSDVTDERRRSDAMLRELEVLQQVVDHADAVIVLKDLDGRYLMLNRAAVDATGRPLSEMLGRRADDFMPAPEAATVSGIDAEVVRTGRAVHEERLLTLQEGRPRRFLMVGFPAYDSEGRLVGTGTVATDVTRRRETERQLEQALGRSAETVALLETLLRCSPVGFAYLDRDFRYVKVNEALAELNGLEVQDHIGRHVREVVPDVWARIEPIYHQVLETGQSVTDLDLSGEHPLRPGERREWQVSYYPVTVEGTEEPVGIGVLAHDVTAQRRLEAQLHQAQKLEAVGRLAGGIAHDFNNVLAAVTLTAELGLQGSDDGTAKDALERILTSVQSASGLTNQLLVFSRQERMTPVPVDVAATIGGVRALLDRTLGDDVVLVVEDGQVPPVLLDPSQLEQILINLAINARDAMPGGGTLTIATSTLSLGGDDLSEPALRLNANAATLPPGGYVAIRVSDTGTGMLPEVQRRALEPFFTTKGGHGTGLGLSTVYGIVRSAAGALDLYSEAGLGTVVRVVLPVAEGAEPVPAAQPTAPVPGSGQHVLVVEDQTDLREVIVALLTKAGYEVSSAEATDVLRGIDDMRPVDLLVTDVVMPEVSGPRLAAVVTQAWPGTQVLFLSGYTAGMLESQGLAAADTRLLVKPFTGDELLHAVAEVLAAGDHEDGSPTATF